MIGEILSSTIKIITECYKMFNNRLIVLLESQNGVLVRRRTKFAIIIGTVSKKELIVAISKEYADKLTIIDLDNKIYEIRRDVDKYKNTLLIDI